MAYTSPSNLSYWSFALLSGTSVTLWLCCTSPQSLYPQSYPFIWTPKTTVFSTVCTRFLLFPECEEVVRECWLYLTLKERWGSKELLEWFFYYFLTDLCLQALHPAEVPSPSSISILEAHVCALWFTFRTQKYHLLNLSLFLYCHVTSPLWLYRRCSGNLRNTCLEYCIISFVSHLCLSPPPFSSFPRRVLSTGSLLCTKLVVCEESSFTHPWGLILASFAVCFPLYSHSLPLPRNHELSRERHCVFVGTKSVLAEAEVLQISIHLSNLTMNSKQLLLPSASSCLSEQSTSSKHIFPYTLTVLKTTFKSIETTLLKVNDYTHIQTVVFLRPLPGLCHTEAVVAPDASMPSWLCSVLLM